ncbi:hypothetical protein BDV32DRAFT_129100 [Aspergillus pseudonomiae]|uniref:Uncharacterized protein n=1 Tax=Aspergillus pseudonomiae TaxID=1506151 RepID=A0A5N6HR98_9EURO|nr:uncharacterized protein BDV37DRAFT_265771 [Aspergillus pseudonomiae]KAB8256364.1 hypothetical protein BDV32DRAFT_129100 [Aspergillus pseudonomiae]KAE8397364.1 hypothetical protein BDV37DRAFT_265771 [Aspergillus pseudonomiae]
MSNFSTVVTFLTVGAVTSHVTEATARVASLLTATISTPTLRAVPRNVAYTAALITFLTTSRTTVAISRGCLRTFTRDMANTTATVAGLLLRRYCAFTANMSLSTTVVTSWGTLLRTVTGLKVRVREIMV